MTDRKIWGCFECGAQLSPGPGSFYICIMPHCKRWAVKMRLPSDGTAPRSVEETAREKARANRSRSARDGWEIRRRREADSAGDRR